MLCTYVCCVYSCAHNIHKLQTVQGLLICYCVSPSPSGSGVVFTCRWMWLLTSAKQRGHPTCTHPLLSSWSLCCGQKPLKETSLLVLPLLSSSLNTVSLCNNHVPLKWRSFIRAFCQLSIFLSTCTCRLAWRWSMYTPWLQRSIIKVDPRGGQILCLDKLYRRPQQGVQYACS